MVGCPKFTCGILEVPFKQLKLNVYKHCRLLHTLDQKQRQKKYLWKIKPLENQSQIEAKSLIGDELVGIEVRIVKGEGRRIIKHS